jgi:hypothetical protein
MPHDELATRNATVGIWLLGLHLILLFLTATTTGLLDTSLTSIITIRVFLLDFRIGLLGVVVVAVDKSMLSACVLLAACMRVDGSFFAGLSTGEYQI